MFEVGKKYVYRNRKENPMLCAYVGTTYTVMKYNEREFIIDTFNASNYEEYKERYVRVGYMNLYENGELGKLSASRKEADDASTRSEYGRIACVRVVLTEGTWDV